MGNYRLSATEIRINILKMQLGRRKDDGGVCVCVCVFFSAVVFVCILLCEYLQLCVSMCVSPVDTTS